MISPAGPGVSPESPPPVRQTLQSLQTTSESGLSSAEAQARTRRDGPNALPEKRHHPVRNFLKKFWNLSAWMIELIAGLSFLVNKSLDMWIALSLLVVNAVLSFAQEQRANGAVAALRSRLQVMARVLRDGSWQTLPAQDLVVGDIIRVRAGDFIPADLQMIDGRLQADQSVLTGESQDVEKLPDALLYSGSIVRTGEGTAVVTATGPRTLFGKTTQLVEMARPQLHVEKIIARVVRWLVMLVATLVALALAVAVTEGKPLLQLLPVILAILMNAVPVALPVMFTVSMALGSMELTRRGVLITQLSAIEDAATMNVLCADKTGTLTFNRLAITQISPRPSWSEIQVLQSGLWASNAANNDPIDQAFVEYARERRIPAIPVNVVRFIPFSAATRCTEAWVEAEGRSLHCMKGALRTVGAAAGMREEDLLGLEQEADHYAAKGMRALAVACAEQDASLRLIGLVYLYDKPRPDSARLITELGRLGVKVKMLTGDALPVACEVARHLGLRHIIRAPELARSGIQDTVDGVAEVFPEDKFRIVQKLQDSGHIVGMTGDGVNDAPALRQAEVGIAVSNATDVAKGAASAVLTSEGLGNIVDLIKTGRSIYQRILTWILYKVSQTLLKAGFVVISFLVLGKFTVSLLGIILLVFMNDFMMISLATDHVKPSATPETWQIGAQVRVAVIVGMVMLLEALGLLAYGLLHWGLDEGGPLLTYGFEILGGFAMFAVLSLRERQGFWLSRPSPVLLAAVILDAFLAVGIGRYGLAEMNPLPWPDLVAIFVVTGVLTLGPNDWLKAMLMARLQHSDSPDARNDS